MNIIREHIVVNKNDIITRIDVFIAQKIQRFSRTQIKYWILNNYVKVNHRIVNVPKKKLYMVILLIFMLILSNIRLYGNRNQYY
ncbi:S4 domain-containing protein [Enterobacteriaceae endosymbiont of Macroplea mutica]|uniref:S4 domain-containing protein n=1 Tax=Enterobacteriaceae endosymbiont of Macroplea mutica TaxID=2675791 RepID=UPI001456E607|nr:S4 domain-containing protein [Enterobacteriaceae endosymbiont of Macroplea mutica]